MSATVPGRLARRARYELARGGRLARDVPRWASIARTRPATDAPRVFYGHDRLPRADEISFGGMVKFQLLAESFPNASRDFNVVYLGSSSMPVDAPVLVRLARRRGARFVWNQNGVAYRAWFGPGYERINRPRSRLLHEADHVIFQSAFCRLSADRFYGERHGPSEILHNPVDTERFTPRAGRADRPLTLLLGGNQYQRYRLETALRALAELADARLVVTGGLTWSGEAESEARALASRLGVAGRVELLGAYAQADAPEVIRRADVLLHTKYNDPCPTIVLEAMACGLPVVYSAIGGVPELVGGEAGIGIPAPLDWERDHPPEPAALAGAVRVVGERLDEFAAAARARAERFDAKAWVAQHRELFEEVLG